MIVALHTIIWPSLSPPVMVRSQEGSSSGIREMCTHFECPCLAKIIVGVTFKLNHNGIGIVILKIAVVIIIVDNNMNKTGEIKKTKQQQQHR